MYPFTWHNLDILSIVRRNYKEADMKLDYCKEIIISFNWITCFLNINKNEDKVIPHYFGTCE